MTLAALSVADIERRLAVLRPARAPLDRLLGNVEGPMSAEFAAALERPLRPASVLLALFERPAGLTVLFTERAAHLKDHAGQISFPGGRLGAGETAVDAALREAEEEIGLAPSAVAVLGTLDVHLTGTGFAITPIVGFVAGGTFESRPHPDEVASVFEVPLEFLLEPANMSAAMLERLGTRFRTYEIHYGRHRIWGATAAMLNSFRDVIADDANTKR